MKANQRKMSNWRLICSAIVFSRWTFSQRCWAPALCRSSSAAPLQTHPGSPRLCPGPHPGVSSAEPLLAFDGGRQSPPRGTPRGGPHHSPAHRGSRCIGWTFPAGGACWGGLPPGSDLQPTGARLWLLLLLHKPHGSQWHPGGDTEQCRWECGTKMIKYRW